jgi:hypothetical protein
MIGLQETCFTTTADIRMRFEKCMDGKKQKKSFTDEILAEKSPTKMDIAKLEQLYDVAFDDTARTYPEFKRAGSKTTYGSLPGKELLDKVIVSSSDTPFANFMKALGASASSWVVMDILTILLQQAVNVRTASRSYRLLLNQILRHALMHSISRTFVISVSSGVHTRLKPQRSSVSSKQIWTMSLKP